MIATAGFEALSDHATSRDVVAEGSGRDRLEQRWETMLDRDWYCRRGYRVFGVESLKIVESRRLVATSCWASMFLPPQTARLRVAQTGPDWSGGEGQGCCCYVCTIGRGDSGASRSLAFLSNWLSGECTWRRDGKDEDRSWVGNPVHLAWSVPRRRSVGRSFLLQMEGPTYDLSRPHFLRPPPGTTGRRFRASPPSSHAADPRCTQRHCQTSTRLDSLQRRTPCFSGRENIEHPSLVRVPDCCARLRGKAVRCPRELRAVH